MTLLYHVVVSQQHFDDEDTYLQSFYGTDKRNCAERATAYVADIVKQEKKRYIQRETTMPLPGVPEALIRENCSREQNQIDLLPVHSAETVAKLLGDGAEKLFGNVRETYFYWHRLRLFELNFCEST